MRKLLLVFVVVLSVSLCALNADAACGDTKSRHATMQRQSGSETSQPAFLLNIADDTDPIVGMWHVTFTAEGNNPGPPDGAPIDNALVVWHNDGTEIMNSGRPPQDGDFCMGVWKKTGRSTYKLNHFAWGGNDATNAPGGIGNPAGPTRILEQVRVSSDGKHYSGRFTLDAYDTSGNVVAHIVGVIQATRITIDTDVPDLL